jgi:uncharacterized protein (DUF1800 family)
MGTPTVSRREFFRSLKIQKQQAPELNSPNSDDPLFDKYSRKSLGPRVYSNVIGIPNENDPSLLNRIGNITSGINPYTGTWSVWEVAHLLRRASFGVKKADLTTLLAMSPSAAVDSLFTFTPVPVSPSPTPLYFNTASYPDTLGQGTGTPVINGGVAQGADWTTSTFTGYPPFGPIYSRRLSLEYWHWGVCINEPASIREKMQQFWYHFIPVGFENLENLEHNAPTMLHDYMKLLRTSCLGNFKTLIKSISKTPAMLVYLSNQYSTASAPNENFARELLELFTMGKVPTQNYTEPDIIAASKVFSGWRVPSFIAPYASFGSAFNASRHNQTNKVFSSLLVGPTNTTIVNQTGAAGANEFDIFFDMLFTQQATTISKYICRRLYRYFVYYDIDANVEANVIVPLAALLVSNNWEMAPVVKALFKSEHFYDVANKGVMIKSPIDYIVGLIRTFNLNTTTALGVDKQYFIWRYFHDYSDTSLGQDFGGPPNVAGWKAYYQEPTYYQNWINSETIQKRASMLTTFMNGFTPSSSSTLIKLDFIAFIQQFPSATINDPNLLIDEVTKYLFSVDLPAAYKTQLKQQDLLTGQSSDIYWTQAWVNYLSNPTTANTNIVVNKLKAFFTSLLQLAEYQLM